MKLHEEYDKIMLRYMLILRDAYINSETLTPDQKVIDELNECIIQFTHVMDEQRRGVRR